MAQEVDTSEVDIYQRLEEFRPVRGRFDSWIFKYGLLLVLGIFNLTGLAIIAVALYNILHPSPQPIIWTNALIHCGVFLTLLVEFLVFRGFLEKIPEAFRALWQVGALEVSRSRDKTTERFVDFLDEFEQSLNSRRRFWLGAIGIVIGLSFCWRSGFIPLILRRWFGESDLATSLITTAVNTVALLIPASVVGYTMGIGAWISVVTGLRVHRFGRDFNIVVQSNHPDRAGGLKPLGDLIFSLAAILVVASLALSGLTIYADYVAFRTTGLYSRILLGLVLALSLIAFFLPLITIHNRMVDEKKRLKTIQARITRRAAELERAAQIDFANMDREERQEIFGEVDSLKELYQRSTRMPTWPFDRDILLRFATPQVISLLSLAGIANPIISAVGSMLSSLTNK